MKRAQPSSRKSAKRRRTRAPATNHPPLTLEVTDFGPIARASVELRPLTVFVGTGNTGKSWLATLVYALYRYFGIVPASRRLRFQTASVEMPALPEGARADLLDMAERWIVAVPRGPDLVQGIEPSASVAAAIRLHIAGQAGALGAEIERCLGIDTGSHLIRMGGAGRARILLRHAVEAAGAPAMHELTFDDEKWALLSKVPPGLRLKANPYWQLIDDPLLIGHESESVETRQTWDAAGALARDVLPKLRRACHLPAERAGLMNVYGTLVSALVESAAMAESHRAGAVPPLSVVQGDFLAQLLQMEFGRRKRPGRDRQPLGSVAQRIEEEILGGAVEVGGLPGVAHPHFTYRPHGWKTALPLTQTSSMVSELAPLVLCLRNALAPGDLLIIDEPESHLHPAMQVAFIRRIAEIVRAGVRVMLTTHSEWILEELGNVVGRAAIAERSEGQPGAESLDGRQVGVWLFEPADDGGGATVREVALDADTGLYPSGFDAVAAKLHNDWAQISDPCGDAE